MDQALDTLLAGTTETAVVVPVPAAEEVVGRHRRELDHSAVWGVGPHVTVLYPFLPPDRITADTVAVLGEVVRARVSAFECDFTSVEWFGDDVVWLAPEPSEPFRALTLAVWDRFPECPPYSGAFPEVVPHLTVGSTRLGDRADLVRAAEAVRGRLPFRVTVDRVRLIAGTDSASSWRTVAEWEPTIREVQVFPFLE